MAWMENCPIRLSSLTRAQPPSPKIRLAGSGPTSRLYVKIDVDFDPTTDQEFIDVPGLPTLQSLRLHACDAAWDVSAPMSALTNGVIWITGGTEGLDWTSATTNRSRAFKPRGCEQPRNGRTDHHGERPAVGETLRASTAEISDDDGNPSVFTYQWVRVTGSSRNRHRGRPEHLRVENRRCGKHHQGRGDIHRRRREQRRAADERSDRRRGQQ